MKKKVLWVSLTAPYDSVDHAGGQIHNFYLKNLIKENALQVKLISFCRPEEISKLDYRKYNIDAVIFKLATSGLQYYLRGIMNIETHINPWNRFAGITTNYVEMKIHKKLKELKNSGYYPDVIILEWTQIILLSDFIKKIYPRSKLICIEEDVTFLGFQRRYEMNKTFVNKIRFKKIKSVEISSLKLADQVICNNNKDTKLLCEENLNVKTWVWHPYFNNMKNICRDNINNDILFFGNMNREENYLSAIWFINNVLPKLKINNVRFVILGSKPPKELLKYNSDRVIVTGYVEDIKPYFRNSRCFVAPLLLGAGIKIKVLEAFSSGIPVVTNKIGIEGINASKDKDYKLCETTEDYCKAIEEIFNDVNVAEMMGKNGQEFVEKNFDFKKDVNIFNDYVKTI